MTHFITLKADGNVEPTEVPADGDILSAVQAAVGGYVEVVPTDDDGTILLVNEDGISLDLSYNDFASGFAHQRLYGDVVLIASKDFQ